MENKTRYLLIGNGEVSLSAVRGSIEISLGSRGQTMIQLGRMSDSEALKDIGVIPEQFIHTDAKHFTLLPN